MHSTLSYLMAIVFIHALKDFMKILTISNVILVYLTVEFAEIIIIAMNALLDYFIIKIVIAILLVSRISNAMFQTCILNKKYMNVNIVVKVAIVVMGQVVLIVLIVQ